MGVDLEQRISSKDQMIVDLQASTSSIDKAQRDKKAAEADQVAIRAELDGVETELVQVTSRLQDAHCDLAKLLDDRRHVMRTQLRQEFTKEFSDMVGQLGQGYVDMRERATQLDVDAKLSLRKAEAQARTTEFHLPAGAEQLPPPALSGHASRRCKLNLHLLLSKLRCNHRVRCP